MAYEFIVLERRDAVGWFRFNRPPRNSVGWDMLREMAAAFDELTSDPQVKVIVIASALADYFNTGADLAAFQDTDAEGMKQWIGFTHALAAAVRAAEKPVLASINGVAVGGGLEMSYHADLRFAADNARFGQPEVNIAFIPPVGGTQGLVRLIGRSKAFQFLYGGELIDAETALAIGLVDFVVPAARLDEEVQDYAAKLAKKPANALNAIRRCLIDGGSLPFAAGMAVERAQAENLAAHPNFAEGVAAFLARRLPNWR